MKILGGVCSLRLTWYTCPMPSQYDLDTKAQALALVALGKPAEHVAVELGIPKRTVNAWAQRMRQIAIEQDDKTIYDEDYRIVLRTGEMIHDALDDLAEQPDKHRFLVPLNIVRGTHIDKIFKRRELAGGPPVQEQRNYLIIVNAAPPEEPNAPVRGEVIDGEAKPAD